MNKSTIIILVILLVCSINISKAQTLISINNNIPTPDNNISRSNGSITTVTFSVNGVLPGMALREVQLKFGNGADYTASVERAVITLSDGSNTTALINDNDMGGSLGDAYRRLCNFKLRDHSYLQYFNVVPYFTNGQPYNFGYYRSRGSFSALKTGTNANTIWTLSIKWNGTGYGSTSSFKRIFSNATLVFGPPLASSPSSSQNYTAANTNESCAKAICLQSGDIVAGTTIGNSQMTGYPSFTLGGCAWNNYNNRSSWFKFSASQTTAEISVSGFTSEHQSIVATMGTGGTCAAPNWQLVACPTSMDASNNIPNDFLYYITDGKYGYGSKSRFNHGYKLTGLTPGKEYYLVIDGMGENLSGSTTSNFYIEMLYGADNKDLGGGFQGGCNRTAPLPIELINFTSTPVGNSNQIKWETASELNNAYFIIDKSPDAIHWEMLNRTTGAGNSNTIIYYEISDFSPFETTYYKLTQYDFDGNYKSSNPIVSKRVINNFQIFPNPATDIIHIPNNTHVKITDLQGRNILNLQHEQNNTINIAHLIPGLYLIHLENGEVHKVIKQ